MSSKISQESPIFDIERIMGNSLISGYLKVPPRVEDGLWEEEAPIWEIVLEFDDNTPQDECRYTRIIAPAPIAFEGQLGYLHRLRFFLIGMRSPATVTYTRYEKSKWHFESPDRTLAQILSDPKGPAYINARKLLVEKTVGKGEVMVTRRVDEPVKTWIHEESVAGFVPKTVIEVTFYEDLDSAYIVGQEIALRLKTIFS